MFAVVVVYCSHFLEIDSEALRTQSLWKKRKIPWPTISRVELTDFPTRISITYENSTPENGRILADPENREQFVSDLRRHALHATFDVF